LRGANNCLDRFRKRGYVIKAAFYVVVHAGVPIRNLRIA
jgi:hypothetical protein